MLERLLDLIGGDQDALNELVETFLQESAEIVADMRESTGTQNLDTLRRSAHSLKSTAQDFDAVKLSQLCASLESRCRQTWPEDASAQIDSIDAAFAATRTTLEDYLKT